MLLYPRASMHAAMALVRLTHIAYLKEKEPCHAQTQRPLSLIA